MQVKRIALCLATLAFLSGVASAQETPKVEVFGGYAYQRTDFSVAGANSNGFDASVTANLNRWVGIVADFQYVTGSGKSSFFSLNFKEDSDQFMYTFGPKVTFRNKTRVTPFAHALFGAAHREGNTTFGTTRFSFSDNAFAMALGGGVDVKLYRNLAWRVAQVDYRLTRFGGGAQDNVQISTGLVFQFGKR